jgi:competence protein ComEC
VGGGEATLVRGPDGQALLVDTGGGGPGRADRGERVVVPVLRRLGVRRLAALALTSGVPDRAGGLAGVLEGMPVDEAWVPAGSEDAVWLAPLAIRGLRRQTLVAGERRWLGPVLVTALHPPPVTGAGPRPPPLALRVEWGLFAAVLAGSADGRAEQEMVASGQPLAAPVLLVSGHGSARGSTPGFLAAVAPRIAVIAVGARNPFGHPAPAALARLHAAGATLFRTDADGAVDLTSDGSWIRVRRWRRPGPVTEVALGGAR